MNSCDIYIKDEIPRQRDYNLFQYYPMGAVRSKCALRRLPGFERSGPCAFLSEILFSRD